MRQVSRFVFPKTHIIVETGQDMIGYCENLFLEEGSSYDCISINPFFEKS
jgi:hypothetical protein